MRSKIPLRNWKSAKAWRRGLQIQLTSFAIAYNSFKASCMTSHTPNLALKKARAWMICALRLKTQRRKQTSCVTSLTSHSKRARKLYSAMRRTSKQLKECVPKLKPESKMTWAMKLPSSLDSLAKKMCCLGSRNKSCVRSWWSRAR